MQDVCDDCTIPPTPQASWRVGSGHHLAQRYHYILTQWDRHAVNTSAVCGGCDVTAKGVDDVSVGPPWFFSVGDLHRVAERWKESEKFYVGTSSELKIILLSGTQVF